MCVVWKNLVGQTSTCLCAIYIRNGTENQKGGNEKCKIDFKNDENQNGLNRPAVVFSKLNLWSEGSNSLSVLQYIENNIIYQKSIQQCNPNQRVIVMK